MRLLCLNCHAIRHHRDGKKKKGGLRK
jgi:hypothetical protein